ncbi:acyl-CoA thioesterase [Paraglaciecola psychrophila]|uniref:Thioesterase superfamily protein n=1 Tax=Paraglaciecola psychrophila 170 TaxID=1129794 RepID=K7A6R8_9ALTE|nr:thioesterase family protein [Paraglaciecola psychrophila]AGH47378.1 thioesterase superfamily protein [Paraglaciecola psychrophila 170]GAC36493.1 acyl-CoA thioester hydrolase [Paraglaciecola psychrophila 170]
MFSEEFNVRFYETDALAHVSNTVLVGWFESGREPIFKLFNPELDLQNWSLILASYKVDFLEQIFYGQKVQVRTFISRIGRSSFDVYQELWQQQKKCATGTTTMVHFDYQSKQAVAINKSIKAELLANSYSG